MVCVLIHSLHKGLLSSYRVPQAQLCHWGFSDEQNQTGTLAPRYLDPNGSETALNQTSAQVNVSLVGAVKDGRAHGAGRVPNREMNFARREIRKGLLGVAGEGLENMGCDGEEWALKA